MKGRRRRSLATLLFPILMLTVGLSAAATIASLQHRSDMSRRAQVQIGALRFSLQALENAAFSAAPQSGGSPVAAGTALTENERAINGDLAQLAKTSPPAALTGIQAGFDRLYPVVEDIYQIGAYGGGYDGPKSGEVSSLQSTMQHGEGDLDFQLRTTAMVYNARASRAASSVTDGAVGAILCLLAVFAFFYFRSVRARSTAEDLVAENLRLLTQSRHDANTDALTGLPNRRALRGDLATRFDGEPEGVTLGLFDLDGFKAYNDTFGHAAGDELLERLSTRLATAFRRDGKAYRIGGDEFCVIAARDGAALAAAGVLALSESGPGWMIGSSAGTVTVPTEASNADEALDTADQRMYANKAARKSQPRYAPA